MDKVQYREENSSSAEYKEAYRDAIERLIAAREADACHTRNAFAKDIFTQPEKYRASLRAMLGWPLTETGEHTLPAVKMVKLAEEAHHFIYRVSVEILGDLEMTGLLFRSKSGRQPLVIVQHGGEGTPELISNLYGDTYNYNEMVERVLAHDLHVFAPQLLLWSKQAYGVEYDRVALDAKLKRVGSSISAIEIYGIMRILDYFEAQSYVSGFGMVGLSYGGFYTLYTAALDTRIRSAVSCSFFNRRDKFAWPDWTWKCAADMFGDGEVACLVYPRRLCIEVGKKDSTFLVEDARKEMARLHELNAETSGEWLDYIEFDGDHEFCQEDMPLQRLADDLRANTQ